MERKFVVDLNVGRLAKWLRVIGYDALFILEAEDAELLGIAREQGRIIVTKDSYITKRREVKAGRVKAFLVQSDDFREQMCQVTRALGLSFHSGFSRCK